MTAALRLVTLKESVAPGPSAPVIPALPFLEAIRWFRRRVPMAERAYRRLNEDAKRRAFTLAGVAQLSLVSDVWRALDDAVAKGTDFKAFKQAIGDKLRTAWGGDDKARVATIFRTNVQRAYGAGRYAQAIDPAVARVRPFFTYSAVLDGRTTVSCRAINGVTLPTDHPFWSSNTPPRHFNAVAAGTLVTTDRGMRRIDDIQPGDRVLTHRGRFRRVYAVGQKLETKVVRTLELASGRVLRVTHEHPVLVQPAVGGGPVWREAGDLQVGDQVFEHRDQLCRAEDVAAHDTGHAPSLRDEPRVALEVMRGAASAPVVLPVELQRELGVNECDVENVGAHRVLHFRRREQDGRVGFRWRQLVAEGDRLALGAHGADAGHVTRVASPHACRDLGPTAPPRPVVNAAALGDDLGSAVRHANLFDAATHLDAVPLAPGRQERFAEAQLALEGPQALAVAPVFGLHQSGDRGPVGHVEWHVAKVATIVDTTSADAALCDLSVEEDESYVAAGIVVHNCRGALISLRRSQAEALGITSKPPSITAAKGFGALPGADEFAPDPAAYPAQLFLDFEAKQ